MRGRVRQKINAETSRSQRNYLTDSLPLKMNYFFAVLAALRESGIIEGIAPARIITIISLLIILPIIHQRSRAGDNRHANEGY